MSLRFDPDCATFEDASHYFRNRATQLLAAGYVPAGKPERIIGEDGVEYGTCAVMKDSSTGTLYSSLYIYPDQRGKGRFKSYVRAHPDTKWITVPDCDIEAALSYMGVDFVVPRGLLECKEYRAVSKYYGNTKAKRSGLYYMNHIDEGVAVLEWLGLSERAKRAYMIHPLFQGDPDLAHQYSLPNLDEVTDDPHILILTMEYRNIANAYLSYRSIDSLDDIALSPLPEVNDMLKADKVQNYKDFLVHHANTHPRRKELDIYFRNWLQKLGISLEQFEELRQRLTIDAYA